MKPLIATAIIIASTAIYAESYSEDQIKEMVSSQDDNNDQQVTFNEYYEDTVVDNTDSYDNNNDGYITSGEIAAEMREDLSETINELRKHGVSEADANKTITNELNSIDTESEAMLQRMDADCDNLVEPGELKAFQRQQFNKLDKNKDGVISQADIKKFPSKGFGYRYKH